MDSGNAPSTAENVKESSRYLRGSVVEELSMDGPFSKETVQILKFHGMYQQHDRDARKAGELRHGSMVRVGVPGGVLNSDQYLALDRLADEAGDGSLRITSRQDVQYHRVRKQDLRALVRTLNAQYLTTLAACGDVVRNVTCCPAPPADGSSEELQRIARSLSARLKPETAAYYEIWLDGEKTLAAQPAKAGEEPLYGTAYLPRKFKIGLTPPGDNCLDIYTNDVGLVPVYGHGGLQAFTVLAGGGLGMSPGAKTTHPRLADPICTVEPDQLEEIVIAMVEIHRDHGNRSNRKFARLKYILEAWGVERFKSELEARVGRKLAAPEPLEWKSGRDHFGWHRQGHGKVYLGLPVLSGRVADEGGASLRSALREAAERFRAGVRLTPQQNVLLTDIRAEDREDVERLLAGHGVRLADSLPPILQHEMACPAMPTCGLAITEAERAQPALLESIGHELRDAGLEDAPVAIRTTGCPNGCARPYTAEIGIVGQSVNLYGIYLGGSDVGTRLGSLFAANVPRKEIGERLRPVFDAYRMRRVEGESFGEFCARLGPAGLGALERIPALP